MGTNKNHVLSNFVVALKTKQIKGYKRNFVSAAGSSRCYFHSTA